MVKGRKPEDLAFWCQKNKKEKSEREDLAKDHLIPVIRDHRPAAELKQQSVAELVELYRQNVGEGDLREITKDVKRAWYNRKSKAREYFPVKLNAKQRKSLETLYKSEAYGAGSMSEVITKLIEEARTIQQHDSELRKSLKRYNDRGDELTQMRLGDKHQREKDRLQKQLDKRQEKVTRLEAEMTTLKQLNADLEAELLDVLVHNRLQDIVLAESNIDVSQAYQQIDNDKVRVDMSKDFKSRLTAIKSKRSKLNYGYYITKGENGASDDENGLEDQAAEDHDESKAVSSNDNVSQDLSCDESMNDNGDVEPVDDPNPITKEVKEKVRESRELNLDGESVEDCEPGNSSGQRSKLTKVQSGAKRMANYGKWRKKTATRTPPNGDDNN